MLEPTSETAAGWRAALARESRWLRASPWDMAMLTLIPWAVCALVVWIFSVGVPRDLPIVVIDQDQSALSRQMDRFLQASPGISVVAHAASWEEALSLLRQRQAFGVVIFPAQLQTQVLGGRAATVQWFYNGQFQSHVGGLSRDVRAVVSTLSVGIELSAREKRGAAPVLAKAQFEPIRMKLVTLFNESASYEFFLTLALLPAVMQIFITLAAVTAIGRELKAGSVPEWLATAGGRWHVALATKLAWPALAFGVMALAFVLVMAGVRGWAITDAPFMVLVGLGLLVAAQLALGVFLIGVTLALRNGLSAAGFITAPAFAFAGQGFPLQSMPVLARAWAEVLPLTHYLQLQSRHWVAGAPARYGVPDLLTLAAMTLGFGLLGAWLLRRRALAPSAWGRS
ncbi:ABC transporter permease [Ideonella margarita]|uniref:ABC transporter permease n=1 Tax=Ideonella margarita TaxID=2984191 RepID=A0ABU9C615_9BURK